MNKRLVLLSISLWLLVYNHYGLAQTQKPQLTYVSHDQWQQKLKQYQPKIVVVDFWATWCSSCLERFPHMVEMNKSYQNQGVQFVSMLLEDPEEPEAIENARQFLNQQNAVFDHYFMTNNLMESFEKLDLLGIPAVYIYNSKGELAHKLTGDNPNNQFTENDIKVAINRMLNKP